MSKVAPAREDHRNAGLVTGRDHLRVALGAAGLDHRGDPGGDRAGDLLAGSSVASDAFFPFPDGPAEAIEAGATALIQPGGSKRDAEVVAACDEAGVAMVFTGRRHFRH